MKMDRIILKKGRSKPFFEGHPWVFSGAIASVGAGLADGAQVAVMSHEGAFIAWGIYNSNSQIRVRLFSSVESTPISSEFISSRILQAIQARQSMPEFQHPQGAVRLVFSEADQLSGLVIDRYGDFVVVQVTSLAMSLYLKEIVACLRESLDCRGIYLKVDKDTNQLEGTLLAPGSLWGDEPPDIVTIAEHELLFQVALRQGHKTGFYLDQRNNRLKIRNFVKGKRVLDLFCYTGGFALNAARAGAHEVLAVDASAPSLKLAAQNQTLNGLTNIGFENADIFEWLQAPSSKELFDVIVLDPPKMLKHRNNQNFALKGYTRLNEGAIRLLKPGGYLLTNSCSGLVARSDFIRILGAAASKTKRCVQIIDAAGPSMDHPLSVDCPETDYLKSFYCRVG